jgi:hypothetical protein
MTAYYHCFQFSAPAYAVMAILNHSGRQERAIESAASKAGIA